MLAYFKVDHAFPSWPVNLWISAMLVLFRPQVEVLLRQRDQIIVEWENRRQDINVFEDRKLELTGYIAIAVEQQIKDVVAGLDSRKA